MRYLVCFLEEPSAKEMLKGLLPRLLKKNIEVKYVVFEGKQDLEKKLEIRLKGWQMPCSVFLVIRDQDSGDCITIKKNLEKKVIGGGKKERTIIRIACHELESFYLGDLNAVEDGLEIKGLGQKQKTKKYRNPDGLSNASEELSKLTEYQYQKISGSRAISPRLKIDGSNKSHSFNVLLKGIQKITED